VVLGPVEDRVAVDAHAKDDHEGGAKELGHDGFEHAGAFLEEGSRW
jgi:hypothetical protein